MTSRPTPRRNWRHAPGRPSSSAARCLPDGSARRGPCSRVWKRQPETGSSRSTPTHGPEPALPNALVARCAAGGLDLATVAGHFECPSAPLRWLHPALLTTLLVRASPSGGPVHRLIGNGQCMVFRRQTLVAAGGFGPVGHHTVEDVALVRSMATAGFTVGFLDASSLLSVRMFESAREAWRGLGAIPVPARCRSVVAAHQRSRRRGGHPGHAAPAGRRRARGSPRRGAARRTSRDADRHSSRLSTTWGRLLAVTACRRSGRRHPRQRPARTPLAVAWTHLLRRST